MTVLFLASMLMLCWSPTALRLSSSSSLSSSLRMSVEMGAGAWLPIASKSTLPTTLPMALQVAGERLVVWRNAAADIWSVQKDVCPHRLAPLSQGRVDPLTQCIECPYHGQQFSADGTCTRIPQLEDGGKIPRSNDATTLRTHSTGDLLWAFVPLPAGQASHFDTLPEHVLPELLNCTSFTSRELPYSVDFLIENFLDPSHIPFAHHSLQATRADGAPIPMQQLTSIDNATHVELGYQDVIRGRARDGVVSFIAPCYYHFRVKSPVNNGNWSIGLIVLAAPVAPGKCRIFLDLPALSRVPKWFPKWILHAFINRFLDSDIWVHDQERTQRGHGGNAFAEDKVFGGVGSKYVMPTASDSGTRLWRQWWRRHMADSPVFGEPRSRLAWLSRAEQLDRYEAHTKHCTSCLGALANARRAKALAPFAALLLLALAPSTLLRVLAVAIGLAVDHLAGRVVRAMLGPQRRDVYSAAQFPAK